MRWSLFFLISGFTLFCLYIGWEQGAFAFTPQQMGKIETATPRKDTSDTTKIAELSAKVKEPLKSELLALTRKRKLDEAVKRYEKAKGKQPLSVAYGVVIALTKKENGE